MSSFPQADRDNNLVEDVCPDGRVQSSQLGVARGVIGVVAGAGAGLGVVAEAGVGAEESSGEKRLRMGGSEGEQGGMGGRRKKRLRQRTEVLDSEEEEGSDEGQDSSEGGQEDNTTDDDDDEGLEEPVRKQREAAAVWDECAKRVEGGAKCLICKKMIRGKDSNTSNINKHVFQKHPTHAAAKRLSSALTTKREKASLAKKLKAKKATAKPSILNFVTRRGLIDPVKSKRLDEALVEMTIAMNKPFNDVENHFFRKVIAIAEPNYIVPSVTTHIKRFDEAAVSVREKLKKEIVKDLAEAGHNVISVTSDHGTSADRFRTKKNVVNVIRTTKDFRIKTSIVKMIKCKGSQTGLQIRKDVKEALEDGAGMRNDWIVNWMTDGEAKQKSARNPTYHLDFSMNINFENNCVDHTLELGSEETLEAILRMKDSIKKLRCLVNYMKDSSTAREKFHEIMLASGMDPLTIIQGTDNRWFHKYSEAHRALLLREVIDKFFGDFETPNKVSPLDDDDWKSVLVYENAMRTIVKASRVFEGAFFPTSSSVIPFLHTIFVELAEMKDKLAGVHREYVELLLANLKKRFPQALREQMPFNCLTLLDPR